MTNEVVALLTIGAAVIAGISWNTLGIWQKYRNSEDSAIDWGRVKKNVIIGAVLGVIAFGVQLSGGETTHVIISLESFITAVIGFFPLIVVADKIFTKGS